MGTKRNYNEFLVEALPSGGVFASRVAHDSSIDAVDQGKNIRIRIIRNRRSPYNIFRSSTSRRSERNIPVLLRGVLVAFAVQVLERGNQLPAGLARLDHFVDEAAARRDVGVGEFGAELGNLLPADGRGVGRGVELALVKNVDRAFRPHHREL